MTKRVLSFVLCLAVLLVSLPIVPFVAGNVAKAEETETVVYDNGPDFRIERSG